MSVGLCGTILGGFNTKYIKKIATLSRYEPKNLKFKYVSSLFEVHLIFTLGEAGVAGTSWIRRIHQNSERKSKTIKGKKFIFEKKNSFIERSNPSEFKALQEDID